MVTCRPLLISFTQWWKTKPHSVIEMEKKICSDEYLIMDHSGFYLNNSQIRATVSQRAEQKTRNMQNLGNLEKTKTAQSCAENRDGEPRDIFLTFANDQTTLVSRYRVCHLLQSPRSSHVAVTSSSATHHTPKTISLLREKKQEKQH